EMGRHVFGWDLPPGVTSRMIDEAFGGGDPPCEVCGMAVDDCLCPECPQCGSVGDVRCYRSIACDRTKPRGPYDTDTGDHGLEFTPEQIEARERARAWEAEQARIDAAQGDAMFLDAVFGMQYRVVLAMGEIEREC